MLSPTIRIVHCDECDLAAVIPPDQIDAGAMLMAQHLATEPTHVPHVSDIYKLAVTHKRKPRK
jgi:hypothetical protein